MAPEILKLGRLQKLRLSVKLKCLLEIHSKPSSLKFLSIVSGINQSYSVTNIVLLFLYTLNDYTIDRSAVNNRRWVTL